MPTRKLPRCLVLCTVGLFLAARSIEAQSAYATRTAACQQACTTDQVGARGPAAVNPFFLAGGEVGFTMLNRGDFEFSPFALGKLQWNLESAAGRLGFAVITNVSKPDFSSLKNPDDVRKKLTEIVTGEDGVTILGEPYFLARTNDARLKTQGRFNGVLWASAATRLAGVKDTVTNTEEWVHHTRGSVGAELHWYRTYADSLPLTLSVEPAITAGAQGDYRRFFGSVETQRKSIEVTLIVPLRYTFGWTWLEKIPAFNTLMVDAGAGEGIAPQYRMAFLVMK